MKSIVIPKSVTQIEKYGLPLNKELAVHCYKDSFAYKYATENNIAVVLLDKPVQNTSSNTSSVTSSSSKKSTSSVSSSSVDTVVSSDNTESEEEITKNTESETLTETPTDDMSSKEEPTTVDGAKPNSKPRTALKTVVIISVSLIAIGGLAAGLIWFRKKTLSGINKDA